MPLVKRISGANGYSFDAKRAASDTNKLNKNDSSTKIGDPNFINFSRVGSQSMTDFYYENPTFLLSLNSFFYLLHKVGIKSFHEFVFFLALFCFRILLRQFRICKHIIKFSLNQIDHANYLFVYTYKRRAHLCVCVFALRSHDIYSVACRWKVTDVGPKKKQKRWQWGAFFLMPQLKSIKVLHQLMEQTVDNVLYSSFRYFSFCVVPLIGFIRKRRRQREKKQI